MGAQTARSGKPTLAGTPITVDGGPAFQPLPESSMRVYWAALGVFLVADVLVALSFLV
jgi:hypothetical protein